MGCEQKSGPSPLFSFLRYTPTWRFTVAPKTENRKALEKAIRAERKLAGLCINCPFTIPARPIAPDSLSRCPECREQANANAAKRRANKKALGLCPMPQCKNVWSGPTQYCPECLAKSSGRNSLKPDGMCNRYGCKKPVAPGVGLCQSHREDCGSYYRKRRDTKMAQGLCQFCNSVVADPQATKCTRHILEKAARDAFGDKGLWTELESLFSTQQGVCPYTGTKLRLGVDASVDHKTPTSRGGPRTIANVEWVRLDVNKAKSDMTPDEFRAFIRLLATNLSS